MTIGILLKSQDWTFLSQRRWLKASELNAINQAQQVLDAAETRAQEIIQSAKQRAKREAAKARSAGLEQGKQELAQQIADVEARAATHMEKLKEPMARMVAEAVTSIAGEMLGDDWYLRALSRVTALVREAPYLTLTVDPESLPIARAAVATLTASGTLPKFVDIKTREGAQPGTCLLTSELGSVDASLATQLQAVRAAIEQRFNVKLDLPELKHEGKAVPLQLAAAA